MHVFILTYCRKAELLYGTTMVFDTLRTGFPHSEVTVVDNASVPEVRPVIAERAKASGCRFVQLSSTVLPEVFFEGVLGARDVRRYDDVMNIERLRLRSRVGPPEEGTVVFVDPDVCFWQSCEAWNFEQLVAGRLIPAFRSESLSLSRIELPRLHTSFLWVPDVRRLRVHLQEVWRRHPVFEPFMSYEFKLGGNWYFLDRGAALYMALGDDAYAFTERELDCYDHLCAGSYLDRVLAAAPEQEPQFLALHDAVRRGEYQQLKGAWRWQEDYFRVRGT